MTITQLYEVFKASTGVSTDTRSIAKDSLFFALKGDNFDANTFAKQAIASGAKLAVIDNQEYATEHTVLVDNVLKCLQDLSNYHRRQLKIPVIGLTGSNGKTTSKELMAAVLNGKYHVAFTKGNLNNHIGVPLTLLSITSKHEIAIIEMGANHQKEIEFLCSICEPDYGYITNFGKAHLEGFGGVEGVIKGKSELYNYLRKGEGKVAFVNADDPLQVQQAKGLEQVSFGKEPGNATQVCPIAISGATRTISVHTSHVDIHTQLTGQYNFSNIAAAIAIGEYFKVPINKIKEGLESYEPQNNRSQLTETDRNLLIVDTYNANPSSMEEALINLKLFPTDSKWVILGDMFEMGEFEMIEHQKIADLALAINAEKTILVGRAFKNTSDEESHRLLKFTTTDDLTSYLKIEAPKNKTILLKGSRGMALEKCIPLL